MPRKQFSFGDWLQDRAAAAYGELSGALGGTFESRAQEASLYATGDTQWIDPLEMIYDGASAEGGPLLPSPPAPVLHRSMKRGEDIPVYLTEAHLSSIRDRMRFICSVSEYATSALENRVNYVFGTGFDYRVTPKRPDVPAVEIRKAQQLIDLFCEFNAIDTLESEAMLRHDIEGESFLRIFPWSSDGMVKVRFVEPEHVRSPMGDGQPGPSFGVITDPNDVEDVKAYSIVNNPNLNNNPEPVPAAEVVHIKAGNFRSAKRGRPVFYPVERNLRRVEQIMSGLSSLAKARAKIALIRRLKGVSPQSAQALVNRVTSTSVTDPYTGVARNIEQYRDGSIVTVSEKEELEYPDARVSSADFIAVMYADLRGMAARLVMPEWMLTSNADNMGAYTSSLVAEAPSTKMFERLQTKFRGFFAEYRLGSRRSLLIRFLWMCAERGYLSSEWLPFMAVEAEAPTLVTRDKAQEATVNKTYNEMGVKSIETIQVEQGLDPEVEAERLAKEAKRKAAQQQQQQPPQPGAPPAGPGGGPPPPPPSTPNAGPSPAAAATSQADAKADPMAELNDLLGLDSATEAVEAAGSSDGIHTDRRGHKYKIQDGKRVAIGGQDAGGGDDRGGDAGTGDNRPGRARRMLARVGEVSGAVRDKATAFIGRTYAKLEGKYGPTGAKLVLAGMIALTPIPAPGTSLLPIALAEGIKRLGRLARGPRMATATEANEAVGADGELAQAITEELDAFYAEMGEDLPPIDDAELRAVVAKLLGTDRGMEAMDRSHLVQKEITDKNGNKRKMWVRPDDMPAGPRIRSNVIDAMKSVIASTMKTPLPSPEVIAKLAAGISELTVAEIHELKRHLGLKASGRKADLARKIAQRSVTISADSHRAAFISDVPPEGVSAQQYAEQYFPELKGIAGLSIEGVSTRQGRRNIAEMSRHIDHVKKLAAMGVKLYTGDENVPNLDDLKHLLGKTPRGWPDGSTWDMVPGVMYADGDDVRVVAGGGTNYKSHSLFWHEAGHAIGYKTKGDEAAEFIQIHKDLFSTLTSYLQQDGPGGKAGRDELFAEAVAAWSAGGRQAIMVEWESQALADLIDKTMNDFVKGAP
jgi:hypothetical protein